MAKKNVLIFESDPEHSVLLRTAFSEYGFMAYVARTESEVQDFLSIDKMDLIIIRVENPHVNGFMLCKNLKMMKELKTVPIMILSSDNDEAVFERHRSFEFAADYYLTLPQDIEKILAAAHLLVPFLDQMDDSAEDEEDKGTPPVVVKPVIKGDDYGVASIDESVSINLELAEEVEKLKSELNSVLVENEQFRSEMEMLQGQLESTKSIIQSGDSLQIKYSELLDDKKGLEEKIDGLNKEVGELKEDIAQKTFQIENLAEKLDQVDIVSFDSVDTSAIEKENASLKQENESLKEQLDILNKKIENISKTTDSTPNSDVRKKIIDLQDENEDLRIINKNMKEKVRNSEQQMSEMMDESEKIKLEYASLNEKIELLEKAVADLEEFKTLQEEELETVSLKLKEKDSELAKKAEEIKTAEDNASKLKEDISDIKTKHEELQSKLDESLKTLEEYNKDRKNLASELERAEEKIKSLEHTKSLFEKAETQIKQKDEKISLLEKEKNGVVEEKQKLTSLIASISEIIKDVK